MMVKAHYEIQVKKVKKDGETYAEATMPREMKHGKTVHYSTTGKPGKRGAEVTVTFMKGKTPYLKNGTEIITVTSKEPPIELIKMGHFFGACSIATGKFGSKVSYDKKDGSGGNHNVT
jgi:hypothetical protein